MYCAIACVQGTCFHHAVMRFPSGQLPESLKLGETYFEQVFDKSGLTESGHDRTAL